MFQRATTNKGVVLILCIFPSLCNIPHSRTINMHTALIYMHIDRQTCPILCIIMYNLSLWQRPLSTTRISTLDASRSSTSQVKTTFIFGCLMIFLSFSGILILGHLLVAKRMYHIWHVSFCGVFGQKHAWNKTPTPRILDKGANMAKRFKSPERQVLIIQMWQGRGHAKIYPKRYPYLNILSIRRIDLSIDLF